MKKISISGQIVILFIIVLLLSATSFSIITISRIYYIAEEETYTRLITYSTLMNNQLLDDISIEFRDMDVAYVQYRDGNHLSSDDFEDYINQEQLKTLYKSIEETKDNKDHIIGKLKNHQGKKIFYVISMDQPSQAYSIIVTGNGYIMHMVKNLTLNILFVYVSIIFLSILGIVAWGNKVAKRIHQIQDHILSLPRTEYKKAYVDEGLDEIGELSRAVEAMRKEISESEKTKQEMLQNISHDFKTPIAVIRSYAEAQQDGMADKNSSSIIINQTDVLKHKVNRLLQYNSLEYLRKDRDFEQVDMKEVVEEVIQGYKFQTDIKMDLDLMENIYFVGYRENYYTVVDNIIDNAKRYAKSRIKIVLKKDRLRIYNDGDPIDEAFIANSFKPYEKGNKGEFGLGMSIVKKTVEFFGMVLIVKNESIGVSFIITKPRN